MVSAFCQTAVVPLLLRFGLAAVFVFHGLQLTAADNEYGRAWMKGPGAQRPEVQQAVAWGELAGGIALAVGFLTRLAAAGLIVIMGGAIALVHGKFGFDIQKHGYEYNVVLIVMCVCLVLGGAGPFAVDRLWARRRE
jgi:putative oxidoreductase